MQSGAWIDVQGESAVFAGGLIVAVWARKVWVSERALRALEFSGADWFQAHSGVLAALSRRHADITNWKIFDGIDYPVIFLSGLLLGVLAYLGF